MAGKLDQPLDSGEERLRRLGYRQEFKRDFNTFTNFAVSFSIISILTGITGADGLARRWAILRVCLTDLYMLKEPVLPDVASSQRHDAVPTNADGSLKAIQEATVVCVCIINKPQWRA